jgi:hypothetical protein
MLRIAHDLRKMAERGAADSVESDGRSLRQCAGMSPGA